MQNNRAAHRTAAATLAAILAAVPLADAKSTCIRSIDIDHTEIPSDNAILFYMKGGTIYRNDLTARCPGLRAATNGFTYEPTNPATDELCDNLATFRVNETGGTGAVCLFGAFNRVK